MAEEKLRTFLFFFLKMEKKKVIISIIATLIYFIIAYNYQVLVFQIRPNGAEILVGAFGFYKSLEYFFYRAIVARNFICKGILGFLLFILMVFVAITSIIIAV